MPFNSYADFTQDAAPAAQADAPVSADQGSAPAAAPVEATSGAAATADADKSGVKPDAAAAVLPVPGAVVTAAAPVQSDAVASPACGDNDPAARVVVEVHLLSADAWKAK